MKKCRRTIVHCTFLRYTSTQGPLKLILKRAWPLCTSIATYQLQHMLELQITFTLHMLNMKFIAYFFVKKKKKIHPFKWTLFLKHGQWFLSFGKECFKRMCNIGWEANMPWFFMKRCVAFVWFMSKRTRMLIFPAFHNVIRKWKLQMKMYEVDIRVLIFWFCLGLGRGLVI